MIGQWIKWEPILGLSPKYNIHDISDSISGFTILLTVIKNPQRRVKIIFEDSVDSYTSTDETFRLKLFNDLDKQYGSAFCQWTFFKVNNSSYIKWLSEQSYGISDERSLIHFSFVAENSVLDVITNYEPKVELINYP